MRKILLLSACVSLSHSFTTPLTSFHRPTHSKNGLYQSSTDSEPTASLKLEPDTHEELLYTLGVNLARQLGDIRPLVEDGQELSVVAKGLLDVIVGGLNEDQQKDLLARRGKDLNKLITERADGLRKKIETMGRNMLQEMAETDGTFTLDCGVVMHPLEPDSSGEFGNGPHPSVGSTVKVHYHGTLPDGTVFDSSVDRKEPAVFALGQVIPGWKEAMQKMHEGETHMIGIPPEMGYGLEGTPDGRIPGGATLFFKVQLLEVLTAGVGGAPTLLGADGNAFKKADDSTSVLLGADGEPLF